MAALTLADVNDIAKEVYSPKRLKSLALGKRPLLNWMPKKEKMGGQGYAVPVWYEDPQSVGSDLSTLITRQENTRQDRFFVSDDEFATLYGVVAITGKAMMGTRGDLYSFLRAKDMQVKGMLRQLGKRLHEELYRSGYATRGQISSIADGSGIAVITFANPSDVNQFGVGMYLVAETNNSGVPSGTLRGSGASYPVAKVDRNAGQITVTGTAAATSSWAATDWLFVEGDDQTTGNAMVKGLEGWIPLTAPSASDNFYTCNRSNHVTRLAGHRVDNSGQEVIQSLTQLATLIGEGEGNPDTIFVHPKVGDALADQVGAKVERMDGRKADVNFTGFRLEHFITGGIDIAFDWACPVNRAFMLSRDTWELVHMGDLPHLVADDGRVALRGSSSDDIQLRGRLFAQPVCYWPGANGVCSLSV